MDIEIRPALKEAAQAASLHPHSQRMARKILAAIARGSKTVHVTHGDIRQGLVLILRYGNGR